MRTIRYSGRLRGRGCLPEGGMSAQGVCLPGVSAQGCVCQTPPCEQNHRQV